MYMSAEYTLIPYDGEMPEENERFSEVPKFPFFLQILDSLI